MLIKVEEFIFSIDFIVLEIEVVISPENKILVILGQLFLTISNALINYRDRKMKLTIGNMIMKLNVFNYKSNPWNLMTWSIPLLIR